MRQSFPPWVRGVGKLVGVIAVATACTSDSELKPFTSDGCSLFPDASRILKADWCSCCFEHDLAYWRGGTRIQREAADLALKDCVLEKTGDETLATVMHTGVSAGGSPYFVNWYRWGYGWSYDRKYQALTPSENAQADDLLEAYFESDNAQVCANL